MGAAASMVDKERKKPLDGSDVATPRGTSAVAEVARLRALLAAAAEPAAPAFKSVHTTTANIHHRTFGDSAKPCVLFIHGAASSALTWYNQVDYFQGNYFVIAMFWRGHGLSTLNGHDSSLLDPVNFGGDVIAVLDEEAVREATLVAHSMGGFCAIRAAFEAPDRISAIVM
ncbi:unnamed protein product [Polarella glacialis]|uniref:AB hydrolase-1 domain-containing protein n=1 Tax=Polarella glacialis TaxID=89957 RepID=A0A813DUP1_POLGL|nr:unnamed protein product [Polarella glacialis]